MSPGGWRRLRTGASLALRVVVIAGALVFLRHGVGWADVASALQGANAGLLAAVIVLNGVMMAVKAARLRILVRGRPSFAACFLAKLSASAINNIAPLRGGDVARVWMLSRHAGITKSASAAVAVVETLLELLALATIAVVVVSVGAVPDERWASWAAPALFGIAIAGLLLLRGAGHPSVVIGESGPPEGGRLAARLRRLRIRISPGVRSLREPGTTGVLLALSLAAWGVETVMVLLCARAIHLPIDPALAVLTLLGINVALVFPALPGGTGAFEAAATLVLTTAGIAKGPAIAFAVLYHLLQIVPVTIAGAGVVSRVGITLGGLPPRRWDQMR